MVTMAQRIEELRMARNMSRPALAAALGLPRTAVEKFETGRQTPTQAQQEQLAAFFGVSLFYLRGESSDKTKMEDWMDGAFLDTPAADSRPTLFGELKTGGVWYQPCGGSYMAALYRDAGIDYLWSDTPGTGSLSLSFEEVLSRAARADLWVFKYADETRDRRLSDLYREFAPYAEFDAFNNGGVWGCNSVKYPFFEDLAVSPDRVLRDFMLMAHPELFSADDTTCYFKRIEK